mgnify:CR=1 FL=1
MDVVIIGAGPVGLFAAFQAGMLGMRCAVIDALEFVGGQCSALYPEKPIYDIPAYPKISGQNLIEQLKAQAAPFNPEYYLNQQVISCIKTDNGFDVTTSKGITISAKVVIIAGGCGAFGPNRPPLGGIEQYEGKSIFYAVHRIEDFRGKRIAIAGGGDSAIDWTLSLAEVAEKIYLIHRRDKFRAAPESQRRLNELVLESKVEMVVPYQLSALEGSDGYLNAVVVEDMKGGIRKLDANILLPFFGLKMSLGPILDWGLNIESHHITVENSHYETNIPGIYAVGDIASYSGKIKLILTGFAECASALHHAYSKVFDGKALHFQYSTSKGLPS